MLNSSNHFQIVHLCGKGQVDPTVQAPAYRQYEYIHEELPDVLAMSDLIVSRAWSNAIFEFLSLRKPMLLIPLNKEQSRGDQILNARSFQKSGICDVLYDEELTKETLTDRVMRLYEKRQAYIDRMNQEESRDSLESVVRVIIQTAKP